MRANLPTMEMVTRVLATTHEVSLKGGNRRWFESKLTANVRTALADLPVARIDRPSWRVLVRFAEPVAFREVARRMASVFGLHAVMPAEHVGATLEDVEAALDTRLEGLPPASFAVRCIRSEKSFPMSSPDIERRIGAVIQARTGWPVDLVSPERTVQLLIDINGIWMWLHSVRGAGGMPLGVGGKALALLSGGIDSPVAAWMIMKRGVRLDFVHFHSVPRTDPASLQKVEELVRLLDRYQGPARLALVPLLPIQEKILARCPTELRVLLYRRFMFRLADKFARRWRCRALVTGDSLGQVASQTVENLGAVEAVTPMPVLRPLIGMDKIEIVEKARRIGSFEISIRPHIDCCSLHVPEHPATRSDHRELNAAEAELDVDGLVREALRASVFRRVAELAPWDDIPLPAGAGA